MTAKPRDLFFLLLLMFYGKMLMSQRNKVKILLQTTNKTPYNAPTLLPTGAMMAPWH